MWTYQFTAFRNERYATTGGVRAKSRQDAKAKLLRRYYAGDMAYTGVAALRKAARKAKKSMLAADGAA